MRWVIKSTSLKTAAGFINTWSWVKLNGVVVIVLSIDAIVISWAVWASIEGQGCNR